MVKYKKFIYLIISYEYLSSIDLIIFILNYNIIFVNYYRIIKES